MSGSYVSATKRYLYGAIGESLLTYCLHFCSLAYDLPHRSRGRIYEVNAKVERAD